LADAFETCFCTALEMFLANSSRAELVPALISACAEALPQPQLALASTPTL
jgi:hypothetical protein